MINVKQILLKIARLPKADQRWIIRQLPTLEKKRFKQIQGEVLLINARRFRKIKTLSQKCATKPSLPIYYHHLNQYSSLYIAIILEHDARKEQFLNFFDQNGNIRSCLETSVQQLKPAAKKVIFEQWKASLSFEACLENGHG
ncbi:hypothetical protein [Legionella fairfieldensis]|uniref:hypothetical protein n=1 Tax=Legionella fairfieldensis TaxID=45064 RepID=UPI00048BEE6E|nr:hypothetical protein [Legionella fairfieldensis]